MKKIIQYFVSAVLLFTLGCANPLEAGAKKDTDEAKYEDAEKLMDERKWDEALAKLAALSSSYASRPEVIRTWSGVLANKCGLDFISLLENLEGADLSSSTLFVFFMRLFQSTSVDPASCDLAQAKMAEMSSLSDDDHMFLAILGISKMGTYLRSLADTNQDGSTDGGYDSCSTGSFSNNNMNNFITGMGLVMSNISYLPGAVSSGDIGSSLTQLNAVCGASCTVTDPNAVQPGDRDTFRDILKTGAANPTLPAGVESCTDVGVVTCCP